MQNPYIYTRLTSLRSTRVIQLYPAIEPSSPISCELSEVSLDDTPQYSALSYTWDCQERSCQIHCSHRKLPVTPNCLAALRQLRDNDQVQTLWIDSISIDQTSLEERSQQVALMGEIYKQASRVIVWLGEYNDGIAKAFKCIADMADSEGFEPENFKRELRVRADGLKQGKHNIL